MFQKVLNYLAKNQKYCLIFIVSIALLFPAFVKNQYFMRIAIVTLQFILLTQSINLLGGMLGQLSLGHIGFYGIGAYTCAILSTQLGYPSIVTWFAAIIVTSLFGLLLALPTLRLKGYYLAIVTMGFAEILRLIELNWMSLTRGPLGIGRIPKPIFFGFKIDSNIEFYFTILGLVILVTLIITRLMDSRLGRAIIAIREDDIAAEAMGINIFKTKTIVFVISAAIAGVGGAFFAQYVTFIDPTSFTSDQSTLLIIMALLGGMGSQVGPFIGAIILTVLPELIRALMEYRYLLYGIIMLLIMQAMPDGLMGSINFGYIRLQLAMLKPNKNSTDIKIGEKDD